MKDDVTRVSALLMSEHQPSAGAAALRRIMALVVKEARQVLADPSSIAVAIVLPVVLILLFGYGLSLDVKNTPVALVLEDRSPDAQDLAARFSLSPYFRVTRAGSMAEAKGLAAEHRIDGIVRIPSDFSRRLQAGAGEIQVLLHGSDANFARIVQGYAEGAVGAWQALRNAESVPVAQPVVELQARTWFNENGESRFFLVPGLIVMVMTISGALQTALVMAREWERGTLEALFVTPARPAEIIAGKTLPYFALGMIGFGFCLIAAAWLFHLPFRGSLAAIGGVSVLYLWVCLGLGLLISSVLRNQFLASLVTLILAFLPSLMLSGFLFDLKSEPFAVQVITYLFPARYYVAALQTLFLVGDIWSVVLPEAAILFAMAATLMLANLAITKKAL